MDRDPAILAAPGSIKASVAGTQGSRINFVDGIRAAAAVYVVLHHIWLTTYPDYLNDTGPAALHWLAYGNVAVSVFIVVSGFSLSIAPARRGWQLKGGVGTYLQRRAWRILPTYWAALALTCLVFGFVTAGVTGSRISLKAVLVHGLLLQDVINSPKPNGAFWSIAVEWQIYFLFPLFLWMIRRLGVSWLVVVVSAGIILAYVAATTIEPFHRLLNVTPQFVALFVMGIAAARVVREGESPSSHRWLVSGASILGGLFVVICFTRDLSWVEERYFWVDLVAGGATACLLACLVPNPRNRLRRFFASRPMRSTGLYSYSIYCVHLPILWLVWYFAVTRLAETVPSRFALLTLIGVPAVLIGSYWFSRVFERPFLTHRSFRALADLIPLRKKPNLRGQGRHRLGSGPSEPKFTA